MRRLRTACVTPLMSLLNHIIPTLTVRYSTAKRLVLSSKLGDNVRMPAKQFLSGRRRYWMFVAVLLLAFYVLAPQLGSFRSSWHLLVHPQLKWVAAGLVAIAATYLAAALTYCLLAFNRLSYGLTVLVQVGAMFVNRLLPGGIGGLGANYAYLRHEHHSKAQAAAMVALNNTLGIVGHSLLVAGTLLLAPDYQHTFRWSANHHFLSWLIAITVIVTILALLIGRKRIAKGLQALARQAWDYRHRPWRLSGGLLSSMVLTLGNVFGLAACCLALGVHLPFLAILLIFSLGAGTGTAVPTPGGVGGFEAGLTAGLIASSVASPTALAVALLYRLISYWLPLVPGAAALVICQRRRLFDH